MALKSKRGLIQRLRVIKMLPTERGTERQQELARIKKLPITP